MRAETKYQALKRELCEHLEAGHTLDYNGGVLAIRIRPSVGNNRCQPSKVYHIEMWLPNTGWKPVLRKIVPSFAITFCRTAYRIPLDAWAPSKSASATVADGK